MCKQDTESAKVAPESVLSNRGNLKGTHFTTFSPGGGVISGRVYLQGVTPYTSADCLTLVLIMRNLLLVSKQNLRRL